MTHPVTVLAPIKLAAGKSETDLLAASARFQQEFVNAQPGILRRELVRKSDGTYLDIVQFRSTEDAMVVMEAEKDSTVCHVFFSIMEMDDGSESADIEFYESLETYHSS